MPMTRSDPHQRPSRSPRSANDSPHVAVVGAGLGGLAAACTLAARGARVCLMDKNDWLGGKAAQLAADAGDGSGAFRFDMGPTILTVPRVLERVFHEAGVDLHERIDLMRLDPQWRCFFEDGAVLDLLEDPEAMSGALREFDADGARLAHGYRSFIEYARRLHEISDRFFFWKSIGGLGDMFDARSSFDVKTLQDLLAMRMGRTVAGTIRRYVCDARVAQMLDHFTQYVGSSPYGSPAILCAIAHMQVHEGVWYPKGGTRTVPEALGNLARELGVTIRTGCEVDRVIVENGRATAVELDGGERLAVDAVVSNMDSVRLHDEALTDLQANHNFHRRREYEPACSGVVLFLGLDRAYDHLAHHDFVFSRDPHEEFDAIYNHGEPAPDPTCYLAATSRSDPATAPAGGEALYVLVHTPFLRPHHNWSKDGELFRTYRRTILEKLKRTGGMADLEQRIVYESALTPQDIHDRYKVLQGAIYGLARRSSPPIAVRTSRGFTSPAARRTPGPACRWC